MTAVALETRVAEVPTPAPHPSSGHPLGWWGMVATITTEATVFALLFFCYFFIRFNAERWPLGDIKDPELLKASMRTIVLVGSSVPMHIAEKGIKRGDRRILIAGLTVGLLMGSLFLFTHVLEYIDQWSEFTPTTNAYGSLFYTITGLHALHLIVGMVMVVWVLYRAIGGRYDEHHHLAVQTTVMYWHFVDGIWIFVFSILYLSVRLL
jgi:heme/copper-type cytochrome/quinol oxidase subunit 3